MKSTPYLLVFAFFTLLTSKGLGQARSSASKAQSFDITQLNPGSYDGSWWNRSPVRLIQTNLREIDALMDTDAYVQSMVDASATVVMLNVGGIVANYPSKLTYHFVNQHMKGDLVGDLVRKLHAKGIKVIGRFDFSKINETFATQKPDWLYVGTNGQHVNYNGQVHTCINGGYQQEYGFEILKEAITNYPFDGIFFNMIGYTTSDYSGTYHGICQCTNCKKRFHDETGMTLPTKADMNDPVFRRYNTFKKTTADELFYKTGEFIKTLNPNLVVNTYADAGVDMIRDESSSWLTDNYEWNYSGTDHVKRVLGSYKDKTPSNVFIYFLAIPFRHTATSPNIGRVWLLGNMLNGAPLDFNVIGTLVNQDDRVFIPILNDLYGFHKKNEKLFTNLKPVSHVGLLKGSEKEYRGMIKLLSEEHIMYDIIEPATVGSKTAPQPLQAYDAVIVGDVANMSDQLTAQLDEYVQKGGKLLVTGLSSTNDETGKPLKRIRLKSLGVLPDYDLFPQTKSTYLRISQADKQTLGTDGFKDLDLLMMYSDLLQCQPGSSAKALLRLVPNTRFGPPEKSYFTDADITNAPGLIANSFGQGKTVFIPWRLGTQYEFKGHHGHRALFTAALQSILQTSRSLQTDASSLIEMTHMANQNGAFEWIGLINHSGQIGASLREPIPIQQTRIRFKPAKPVKQLRLMRAGTDLPFTQSNGWVECLVPKVDDFEMLVSLYR
ncbi:MULTISPECIES: hypothetical protein [unclassified Spirosoma]|uniref:hypothetical protein n=1 Tax=unclassified Spirosoma TaxID=2621999 RepID=UPI00095F63CB|nr:MULTISPECIES: hypothetical protein [unclassified Spirosoma]MBN8824939.1 hypothetical protein [Spirosoma sp.]OJW74742.1 MAG: hypothetical protein BGO59_28300 [Spirosoma sp. 48-14]